MKSINLVLIIGVLVVLHQSESAAIEGEDVVLKAMTYAETQANAIANFKKAAKGALTPYAKIIDGYIKTSKDNQGKGKMAWNGALDKFYAEHKKGSELIQKALKAAPGTNAEFGIAASAAIDAFYVKLSASVGVADNAFTAQLAAHLATTTALTPYKGFEELVVDGIAFSVNEILKVNLDGKGQTCLKKMTPDFIKGIKSFQASSIACMEDLMTYLAFSSEFVKLKINTVKCQADEAIKSLPACLKQITKKTSQSYATLMYTTCLGNYVVLLENGYDGTLGATLNSLVNKIQFDFELITTQTNSCGTAALESARVFLATTLETFTVCSPPPA